MDVFGFSAYLCGLQPSSADKGVAENLLVSEKIGNMKVPATFSIQ